MSLFNKFDFIQEDFSNEAGCAEFVCYTTFKEDTNGEVLITRKLGSVFENNPEVVIQTKRVSRDNLYDALKNYFFNPDNSRRNTCQEFPARTDYVSFVIEEENDAEVFEDNFTPEDLFAMLN